MAGCNGHAGRWSDIKKRTGAVQGQLVGGNQEHVMQPTSYSPPLIGR